MSLPSITAHLDSIINSTFSQKHWVDRISNIVQKDLAIDIDDIPGVCVFQVPNALSSEKPEAYKPQLVAFGPYHHLRLELYQMEKYKLVALKDILEPSHLLHFESLAVDKLKKFELEIRACYQKYMEFDDTTLAWILAIDGLFLMNLLDSTGGKRMVEDSILARDVLMLENQIPFILLREIRRSFGMVSESDPDSELFRMLLEFCEAHTPLKFRRGKKTQLNTSHVHMLDLMYHLIVNNQESTKVFKREFVGSSGKVVPNGVDSGSKKAGGGEEEERERKREKEEEEVEEEDEKEDSVFEKVEVILDLADGIHLKGSDKFMKPVKVIRTMPWAKISGLFRKTNKIDRAEEHPSSIVEAFTVPSASQLHRFSNIKFRLSRGGINDIAFDQGALTLYLPEITLNSSSEVILRNLVAYEVAMSGSSLELTQYVNLMNGLIDNAEDVKLLREDGIIKGILGNDQVADLFNGMKKFSFLRPDHEHKSNLEIAIEEINENFNKRMTVKAYRRMQQQIYSSWRFLTVLSTMVMLGFLALQSFCDVYGCSNRLWFTNKSD